MKIDDIAVGIVTSHTRPVSGLVELCGDWFHDTFVARDPFGRKGAAVNTQDAIAGAHELNPDLYVLLLEDDILFPSRTLFEWYIDRITFPANVGVISLCDMRECSYGCPSGLYTKSALGCDGRGWWGNQAMLIHPYTARLLTNANWFTREINASPGVLAHGISYADGGKNCSDIRMSLIVNESGDGRNQYAVHVPSLAKHVGHRSVCFPDRLPVLGERETRNWCEERTLPLL